MKIEHRDMNPFHLTYGSVLSTTETDYLVVDTGESEPGLLNLSTYSIYYCDLLVGLIDTDLSSDQLDTLVRLFSGKDEKYRNFYHTHDIKLILGE